MCDGVECVMAVRLVQSVDVVVLRWGWGDWVSGVVVDVCCLGGGVCV